MKFNPSWGEIASTKSGKRAHLDIKQIQYKFFFDVDRLACSSLVFCSFLRTLFAVFLARWLSCFAGVPHPSNRGSGAKDDYDKVFLTRCTPHRDWSEQRLSWSSPNAYVSWQQSGLSYADWLGDIMCLKSPIWGEGCQTRPHSLNSRLRSQFRLTQSRREPEVAFRGTHKGKKTIEGTKSNRGISLTLQLNEQRKLNLFRTDEDVVGCEEDIRLSDELSGSLEESNVLVFPGVV